MKDRQRFDMIVLMSNSDVARLLRNIAAAYTIKDEKKFRFQIIAYQKAADAIEHSNTEINELYKEGKLDSLTGVGKTIASHLSELFKKGKVTRFDWVMRNVPKSVYPLMDLGGFGPKKAYKLVTEFKLNDPKTVIDELEKHGKKHQIAPVPGFGEKSESDILRSILEFREGKLKSARMVLPYAYDMAEKVLVYLKKSPAIIEAYPLGSLRRMVATVGDIDMAASSKKPKEALEHFVRYPYLSRVIEKGTATASILISGNRQIDLMVQPPESMGSLLQHFTGSKAHNIHLREYALKIGLSLSEYGIKQTKKPGKIAKYATEEQFYKALEMQWIPPEMRENTGEIELAAAHKLPTLLTLENIKGDLHIHSDYPIEPSHDMGRSDMEEMLEKAKALKYEYLGFSEHNPSITKHTKDQIYTIMSRRKEKIEQLKKSNKYARVINMLEIDILVNGELAINDKALSCIDFGIVSIHSSFGLDKKTMTKRAISGLSHPKAKILAHPTGRLLNERSGYELDWDTIFDFCKKNNKALEINAWPLRLDLPDTLVREAIKEGVKFVIDTDSHELPQMDLMRYGVAVARRGWATEDDILNAWEWTKFAKWFNID